ncbi:hypothetical protein ND748_11565 [Frankia sp. AiPs1]|uniref:hypothetical protein n=1 Tax=Frankia sp. AiPs1 TaxID=573493 RepID=UPI002044B5F7|nr:hypothetical protein [Frankia sp. AiPs1]MCM3922292.1 hypothetical protein [Frankia sp. AiPs1]
MATVHISNAAARMCAADGGMAGPEQARIWLLGQVERGVVTDRLPHSMQGRRSPTGQFCVVDGVLILPLAHARQGGWVATSCHFDPTYLASRDGVGNVDPFALSGPELARLVSFSGHCRDRYRERCGGPRRDQDVDAELGGIIARSGRAVTRRPSWSSSSRDDAEFYLVADDEYMLPVVRQGSATRPFVATTCMHRAQDLFGYSGAALADLCRLPSSAGDAGPRLIALRAALTDSGATLRWRPSRRGRPVPDTRFSIEAGRAELAVDWDRTAATPLTIVRVCRGGRRWRRLARGAQPNLVIRMLRALARRG